MPKRQRPGARAATVTVVTRLAVDRCVSTFVNFEGDDEPYIVSVVQFGPPFRITGAPKVPSKVGDTKTTIKRRGEK